MNQLLPGATILPVPRSVREWAAMHRQNIRTIVDWEALLGLNPTVRLAWFLDKAHQVCYPWAVKGNWMSGATLRKVELGNEPIIVRAPAVCWKHRTILLDGCHRTSQLKPCLLILDVLDGSTIRVRRCFADLLFDEKGNSK